MRATSMIVNNSNIKFRGKLVIVNNFSNKPQQCINKIQNELKKLIEPKDYNLFLQQDYSKNEIRIIADYPLTKNSSGKNSLLTRAQMNIPITSSATKYVNTSANVINQFEHSMRNSEQQKWELKQKQLTKQEILDTIKSFLFAPVFIFGKILHDINPKLGKKFENY